MNLRNRVIRGSKQRMHFLSVKNIGDDGKKSIYLTNTSGVELNPNYSLWNIEIVDADKETFEMWPYEGADSTDLIKELMEDFLEHAFENVMPL